MTDKTYGKASVSCSARKWNWIICMDYKIHCANINNHLSSSHMTNTNESSKTQSYDYYDKLQLVTEEWKGCMFKPSIGLSVNIYIVLLMVWFTACCANQIYKCIFENIKWFSN